MATNTRQQTRAPVIHSGADRSPIHPGKVSLLPHRSQGKASPWIDCPVEIWGKQLAERGEEPSLKQIMQAIYTCQTTLTEHIDGMRAEMSFLKQDEKGPQKLSKDYFGKQSTNPAQRS